MSDLIDRYIFEVAKHLPAESREDVGLELRTTIADMIEDRGDASKDGVRDTLMTLGDPAVLAKGYSPSPRHLIGPAVFDEYIGLLKGLAVAVMPILLAVQLVLELTADEGSVVGSIISALGTTWALGVHVLFWTTLVFVILERTGAMGDHAAGSDTAWSPDDLPEIPAERQFGRGELAASIGVVALIPLGVVWQHFNSPYSDADGPIPLLDVDLWRSWIPALFGLVVLTVAIEIWKFVVGHWTVRLVVANLAVNAAFAAFFIALFATGEVWNPAYVAELARHTDFELDPTVGLLVVGGVLVVTVWDSVECVLQFAQRRRLARVQVA